MILKSLAVNGDDRKRVGRHNTIIESAGITFGDIGCDQDEIFGIVREMELTLSIPKRAVLFRLDLKLG